MKVRPPLLALLLAVIGIAMMSASLFSGGKEASVIVQEKESPPHPTLSPQQQSLHAFIDARSPLLRRARERALERLATPFPAAPRPNVSPPPAGTSTLDSSLVSFQSFLRSLALGPNGTLLWSGPPLAGWTVITPRPSQAERAAIPTRSSGDGGGDGGSPRGGGGSPDTSGVDGKLEAHSHEDDAHGGTIDINGATRNILSVSRGGTGTGSYSTGDLLVGQPGGGLSTLSIGTDGTVLTVSNGTASWQSLPASISTGSILSLSDARYVNVSGDTMTGTLTLTPSSGLALNAKGTISGSLITQNGAGSNYFRGILGIGNTSPSTALSIRNDALASVDWGGVSTQKGILSWDGTAATIRGAASQALKLGANNTDAYVVISTAGNVGIGTITPRGKLHVVGSGTFIGTISGALITQNGAGSNYFMGNVGIGTTSPVGVGMSVLHVRGNGTAGASNYGSISLSNPAGNTQDTWGSIDFYGSSTRGASIQGASQSGGSNYGLLNFYTNSNGTLTRFLQLDGGGLLSLGSSTASAYMSIQNDSHGANAAVLILGNKTNNANSTSEIQFVDVNSSVIATIRNIKSAGSLSGGFAFYTANGGAAFESMRITPGGSVGIGTTSPGSKLSVSGALIVSARGNLGSIAAKSGLALEAIGTISGALITQNGGGTNYVRGRLAVGTGSSAVPFHAYAPTGTIATFESNNAQSATAIVKYIGNILNGGQSYSIDYIDSSGGAANILHRVNIKSGTNAGTATYQVLAGGALTDALVLNGGSRNAAFFGNGFSLTSLSAERTTGVNNGETGYAAQFANTVNDSQTQNIALQLDASDNTSTFGYALLTKRGRTGLGTTTPGSKLSVSGSVIIGTAIGSSAADTGLGLEVIGAMSGTTVQATNGLITKVNAAACSDANVTATNGAICIDSANGRLYFRYGAAWHYAAQTAGFQIPHIERNGKMETAGLSVNDRVLGRIDEVMEDGALHGIWEKFDVLSEVQTVLQNNPNLLGSIGTSPSPTPIGDFTVQGSLFVMGNANVFGDLALHGHLLVSGDSAGEVTIPAGHTSVAVTFIRQWPKEPLVQATPDVPVALAVSGRSASGFTLRIANALEEDVRVSWFAVASLMDGGQHYEEEVVEETEENDENEEIDESEEQTDESPSIPFPVDANGYPISSDEIWNKCIRHQQPFNEDGSPIDCARFTLGNNRFEHPDLLITFTFNDERMPKYYELPEGYVVTIVEEVAEDDTEEGDEASGTGSSTN